MATWLKILIQKLGKSRVSIDPKILEIHAKDAWFASHRPEAVVFADSTATISKTLQFANRHKIPVTARGAGRGYVGGCVPQRGGIVLSLARMNRIKELHVEDGIAVVEPGVITGDLQEAAKKKGLFYPPDPASLKECTLGGNLATNAGGPRCLKYGVTRHYILGLTIVLADGSVVKVGSRTMKNKSGFDLVGLFVGSEGMLGIVSEITVRLLPLPTHRGALSASFTTAQHAAKAVQTILQKGILPSALEIADRFTLEAARSHLGKNKLIPPGKAHLLIEVDGNRASVQNDLKRLTQIVKQCQALQIITAETEQECEKLWELRRQFSQSLKATGLTKLNEDIAIPRSRLIDLFAFAEKLHRRYQIPVACFGHAGDGNIHVNLMVDLSTRGISKKMNQALDELFHQVLAWDGVITGEHGIGLAKKRWWPKAASRELRALHAKIKKVLDPYDLLNPGKFV
ncbi:MAG: FAD-linked oxidase C-terminal domain-containing protein [Verrucomicrobiia bacterium]